MSARVTVLVLCGTPGDDLGACLAALESDAVAGLEVLLVGQGAPDETARRVRWIATDAGDPGSAWNRGAAAAAGDILLFMRADVLATASMVARHLALHETEAAVVVGLTDDQGPGAPPDQPGPSPLYRCAGQTLSVGAVAFRQIGGFATGLSWGGEIDLAHRLVARGLELKWFEGAGRRAGKRAEGVSVEERFRAGQGSVELYRHRPALLPVLELGRFHADGPPGLRLRRLLLRIGAPPMPGATRLPVPGPWRVRWQRFLHEYHFWRGVRRSLGAGSVWQALLRPPVILMYHAIGARGEAPGCYVVPLARFRRQLAWLAWRRYRILGLEELLDYRRRHELPPARAVVITFDDGYADNRWLALEALRERGFRATFFLVSGHIGGRNSWDAAGELAGRAMLDWSDVHALREAGMEIGAHTRTHPVLPGLAAAAVEEELAGSRRDLEAKVGRPVRTFAYPYGRLDPATTAAVARSGYEAACCSRSGVNDPAVPDHLLRRLEVQGVDPLARFALATHRGWVVRKRPRS
jgi:peptidoglycan/xylan/chitin deacetylase (PgdA/CDA1 family)